MDQHVYKSLLSDVKAGELKKFLMELPRTQLTQKEALNFIICCCSACSNTTGNFSPEDLIATLRICSEAIHSLNDILLDSYLRSLYYILKYFVAQENPKYIIQLEFILLPDFMLNLNEKSNKSLYQDCSKIIHNFTSKLFKSEPKVNATDFLELCVLYFKMCFELSPNELVQQKLYSFFRYCVAFEVNVLELHKAYVFILNLLEKKKASVAWNEGLCNSIFVILGFLIKQLVKDEYFSQVRDVIRSTTNCISSNSHFDGSDKAISVVDCLAALITEEIRHPSKNHVIKTISSSSNTINSIKSCKASAVTCILWHTLVNSIVINYRNFSSAFWTDTINEEVQIELFNLTQRINKVYCEVKVKCSCGKCLLQTDIISACNCCITAGHLFRDYCDKTLETQISEKLLVEFKAHMLICCKIISKLKHHNCEHWKTLWKEAGVILYNTSIDTQKLKASQRIAIKKSFLKYLMRFEGNDDSIILKDVLKLSLSSMTNDYLEHSELNKALVTSALNIYLCRNERKYLFLKWAHIKSEHKDNVLLQELNLVTALLKYDSFVKSIHPDFAICKASKIELLVFELEQYKAVWPSRTSINCVLNELLALADIVTVVKALMQFWNVSSTHKCLYDLMKQVLASYEKVANTVEDKIYLACLYYIQYNAARENMRSENMQDMERVLKITSNKSTDNEPAVPDDECDIVSSYEALELNKYNKAMKFLHRALNMFENCTGPGVIEILKENKVYDMLVAIAFEYRLQCYTLEYFRACFLCLKVARMTFNKFRIIESIGYIIEKGNAESNSMRTLTLEADQVIASLVGDDTTEKWEVLTMFYVSKSIVHLLNGDVSTSTALYNDARNAYDKTFKSKNRKLLDIRMDYLQSLLFSLPCEYNFEGHSENSLAKQVLTLHSAYNHYKTEGHKSSYCTVVFFEIYAALVHKYIWMRLPRETRCYSKEITFLAQRLLIPLQTVKFLSYLAQADLMNGRLDDCFDKIKGICEILCISERSCVNFTFKAENMAKSVELLSNRMQEVRLNVPLSFQEQQAANRGSPVCETANLKLPSFTKHHNDCDCYHCTSIDFQECVLVILNLYGRLNACQSNISSSQEHFSNALNVYNHLVSNKSRFKEKVSRSINHDIFPDVEFVLLETYILTLLNIGHNIIGTSEYNEIYKKLRPALEKVKLVNIYIYNEACLQIINNDYDHLEMHKPSKAISLSPVICEQPENASSFVTPESKCSIVQVPVVTRPQASCHKPNVVKAIKFLPFDDEISDGDEPKPTLKAKKKTQKTSFPVEKNKKPQGVRDLPSKSATTSTKLLTEKLKKEGIRKPPSKEIPEIEVEDESEQVKPEVLEPEESERKQDIKQEPRRSKRVQTKQGTGATKKVLRN